MKVEVILKIHSESIDRHGGLRGIRDQSGLESAVAQPQHTFFYGHGDLFDVAAAYIFHIAQPKPFLTEIRGLPWRPDSLF